MDKRCTCCRPLIRATRVRRSGFDGRSVTSTSASGASSGSSLICQRIGSIPGICNASTSRCQGTRTRKVTVLPIFGRYLAIVSRCLAAGQTGDRVGSTKKYLSLFIGAEMIQRIESGHDPNFRARWPEGHGRFHHNDGCRLDTGIDRLGHIRAGRTGGRRTAGGIRGRASCGSDDCRVRQTLGL